MESEATRVIRTNTKANGVQLEFGVSESSGTLRIVVPIVARRPNLKARGSTQYGRIISHLKNDPSSGATGGRSDNHQEQHLRANTLVKRSMQAICNAMLKQLPIPLPGSPQVPLEFPISPMGENKSRSALETGPDPIRVFQWSIPNPSKSPGNAHLTNPLASGHTTTVINRHRSIPEPSPARGRELLVLPGSSYTQHARRQYHSNFYMRNRGCGPLGSGLWATPLTEWDPLGRKQPSRERGGFEFLSTILRDRRSSHESFPELPTRDPVAALLSVAAKGHRAERDPSNGEQRISRR
ncbi:hypothetical protein F5Y14DRAFT_456845 [Nemania sp. NC0429]|nr:hypothetical protein F5Y14DRAFT_456845 [Nemania sp. NC0429]